MPGFLMKDIETHLRTLTEDIGVRLAGSFGERQAADYIADQLRKINPDVNVEEFDIDERAVEEEQLELYINGEWQRFNYSLFHKLFKLDNHKHIR